MSIENKPKRRYQHSEEWLAKHAAKMAARGASVKVKNARSPENPGNPTELFNRTTAAVAEMKKCIDLVGKTISGIASKNDPEYLKNIQTLFGKLGFIAVNGNIVFKCSAKVKIPDGSNVPSVDDIDVGDASSIEGPTDEELDEIEDEIDAETLGIERDEDEDEDEYLDRLHEARQIARDGEEEEYDTREEIYAAQEDNGDFS